MLRRIITVAFGYLAATGCGLAFLPLAAFADPGMRDAGFEAAMAGVFVWFDSAASGEPLAGLGFVLWAVGMAAVAAPLAVTALIGEAAGVRGWLWNAGGCAVLAAASPWILRAARGLARLHQANPLEQRIALLFFLTGLVTGSVYWAIAGRSRTP